LRPNPNAGILAAEAMTVKAGTPLIEESAAAGC
jgi:hypothetical protein